MMRSNLLYFTGIMIFTLLSMMISQDIFAYSPIIELKTDKNSYNVFEKVTISGELDWNYGKMVDLQVSCSNSLIFWESIQVGQNKKFVVIIDDFSEVSKSGTCKVFAMFTDDPSSLIQTSFEIFGVSENEEIVNSVDWFGEQIDYQLIGGKVQSTSYLGGSSVFIFDIIQETDGKITIAFPRTVLDSKLAGMDIDFVLKLDRDFEETVIPKHIEKSNEKFRIITVNLPKSEYISLAIQGTFLKTEFGDQPNVSEPVIKNQIEIPSWVRNNAKWFAEGNIGDSEFTSAIEFLIEEKIINIPNLPKQASEKAESKVPDWIKSNAEWWSSGQIDDETFVQGIEFLVEKGIIQIS